MADMKKVFSILTNVVFTGLMTFALVVTLSMFSIGGIRIYSVLSGSMEPTIHTGSVIVGMPADSYAVGDIVTRMTETDDVTVTHRIVEKVERDGAPVFRTKGDANNVADDEDIPASAIVGRVAFSVPYLGFAMNFAKTREGFLLLVIIPAVLVIYEELKKMKDEIARMWNRRKEKSVADSVGITERMEMPARTDMPLPTVQKNIGNISFAEQEVQAKRRIV